MVLVIRHPVFTLNYALVAVVFIFMSLVVPYFWLIFNGAFLTLIYIHGVNYLVQLEQGKVPDLDGKPLSD